jgi:hypothetical protein
VPPPFCRGFLGGICIYFAATVSTGTTASMCFWYHIDGDSGGLDVVTGACAQGIALDCFRDDERNCNWILAISPALIGVVNSLTGRYKCGLFVLVADGMIAPGTTVVLVFQKY